MLPQEIEGPLDLMEVLDELPMVPMSESFEELDNPLPPPPPSSQPTSQFAIEIEILSQAELADQLMKKLNFPIGFSLHDILELTLSSHSQSAMTGMGASQQMEIPAPFKEMMEINQATSANLIMLRAQIEAIKKELEQMNLSLQERLQRLKLEIEGVESVQEAAQESAEKSGPPLTLPQSDKTGRKPQSPAKRERSYSESESGSSSASSSDTETASTSSRLTDDDDAIFKQPLPPKAKAKKGKRPRKH